MANGNNPYGLLQIQGAMGAPANFEMTTGTPLYSDTNKIFTGDPVKLLSTGYIAAWTAATAVSQLAGIFAGCEYLSTAAGKMVSANYWPGADVASTAQNSIVCKLIPCTGAVAPWFRAQSDSTGIAFADIGQTIDVNMGTGSTTSGQSGAYLDTTTMSVTATLPFRIRFLWGGLVGAGGRGGIQPSTTTPYGGSATGAYNWVIVNANVLGAGATGI
jgi:hypothetical protein